MSSHDPYNPLSKYNLGESVADALLRAPVHPISKIAHLMGAGVYAIYYVGPFQPYRRISELNVNGKFEQPIYIGKAVPKGARKGGVTFDAGVGTALRDRLRQHALTIAEVGNIDVEDFFCKALPVDDIWIPLGENVLIEKFQPLWNRVIDGFGNKTPGRGRATQKRSSWDVLHPGRKYVELLALAPSSYSAPQILSRIEEFYEGKLSEADKLPVQSEEENGA